MKFLKSLALIATGIALAACGSSGSSGIGGHHSSGNGGNLTKSEIKINSSGSAGSYLTEHNHAITTGLFANGDYDKMQVLRVNGQDIQMVPANIAPTRTHHNSIDEWRTDNISSMISTDLMHARYGTIKVPELLNQPYIFAQGNLSDALPTHANPVTYQGRAIYIDLKGNDDKKENFDNVGTSQFTVHFDKKTVDGTLKFDSKPDIFLHGKIDGSHFNGKMGNVITRGAFYGKDAAELAGTFHQEGKGNKEVGDFAGAFGAKQQK
ncbi:transferrin-binding protein-like solute binding protein [Conchiformibius steedae]|uniref:Transferrin-binding protein B C-lobe/N-lobe beta-barrel domain-containing protein n=1 Tax=Conchiformibius steedae TaxID=153493 RepID=A0A3P2A657_9NEIS|nr:transferrin-binding protein-like solute binding protein [Conchiformibius steedae]RRD90346.1 hypothetical protein EII21_05340 [Conchiformibius steedae]